MISLALVTDRNHKQLVFDDRLLIKPLIKAGFNIFPVIWDDPKINLRNYQVIVFRSAWDYYLKIEKFINWLDRLEAEKIKVFNPVNIIRWNIDKKYLLDLEKLGIKTVPTLFSNKNSLKKIDYFQYFNSPDIIIKPRFGASGYRVNKLSSSKSNKIPAGFLVQPYLKEIETAGELSIVFINNQYSHCVKKQPKKGDFRTSYEFGAKWTLEKLDQKLKREAEDIIKRLAKNLLYARIDAIPVNGKLQLMELEVTEPFLFLSWHLPSVQLFVESLATNVARS